MVMVVEVLATVLEGIAMPEKEAICLWCREVVVDGEEYKHIHTIEIPKENVPLAKYK